MVLIICKTTQFTIKYRKPTWKILYVQQMLYTILTNIMSGIL